jgi:hypothetical protein
MGLFSGSKPAVPVVPQTVAEIVEVFNTVVKQLEDHAVSKNQEVSEITERINFLVVQKGDAYEEAIKADKVRQNILKIIETS